MDKVRKKLWIEPFPGRTLNDIWYNLKLSFKMLKAFFWYVWWFRGFDYHSFLMLIRQAINILLDNHLNSKVKFEGQEEVMDQMRMCIGLLTKLIEDDYETEFGYDTNFEINFEPIENSENFRMVSTITEEQKEHNSKVRVLAKEQKEKDQDLLFKTIRENYERWWW